MIHGLSKKTILFRGAPMKIRALCPIFLIVFFLRPAEAQQQRYQCPEMSPAVRTKLVSGMTRNAETGRFRGCDRGEGVPLDIDCELAQSFVVGGVSIGVGNGGIGTRYLGTPWSVLVACFPELKQIKSINEQATARNVELEKKKEEETRESNQRLQAKDNDPMHVLTRTYYDYIIVKRCFEQRQGYTLVNISDQEMERAKKAAKGIEEAIQRNNHGIDTDTAWRAASSESEDWKTETDKVELMLLGQYNSKLQLDLSDRNRCQNSLQAVETRFKRIAPEANAVKKDF
jgi:hypothetical protein